MKECTRCHNNKELDCYSKDCTRADGISKWCKDCWKIYYNQRKHTPEHVAIVRKNSKRYYWRHREKNLQRSRNFREENKEYLAELNKQWRKDNPERVRELYRRWTANNPERVSAIGKRKRANKYLAHGTHTSDEWLRLKEDNKHSCVHCHKTEPFTNQNYTFLTEDHITPLSNGGSNDIANIQPLCFSCNSRKNNRSNHLYSATAHNI